MVNERTTRGERAQSGIIGFVLLIGLVLGGALLVLFTGTAALGDLQQDRTDETAKLVMEDVDSQLATVTNTEYDAKGRFSMADLARNSPRVVRQGFLNVTVNRRDSCRTNMSLSAIEYESPDGQTVAYQAGGVWVTGSGNGSAMQTAPDVQFRNGSLDITLTNVTGNVSRDSNQAFYNATTSQNESAFRSQSIIDGPCADMDNVTVEVKSEYYVAWASYLEEELGVPVAEHEGNRTAVAHIPQHLLPRRVDENRNNVVNLSTDSSGNPLAPYMEAVNISGNSIRVNKTGSNQYTVYVQPMNDEKRSAGIGRIREIETAQNVSGPPLDVVFVMDESGSMSEDKANPDCTGDCATKREAAIPAAQNFTAQLNSSRDRVGLVGFYQSASDNARYHRVDGRYLTNDFDAFNDTVDDIDGSGGTQIWAGLRDGNRVMGLKSNQTRERIIVLLSDGRNNPGVEFTFLNESSVDEYINGTEYSANITTKIRAREAAEMGVTVHTIGFGGAGTDFNEGLLQYINQTTGGLYFHAENASQLNDAFSQIADYAATSRMIALTPTTTNLTTGNGGSFAPQIAGDTDDVAFDTVGGDRYMNVNDPTAPSQFSHAFALSDNESVTFNASTYDCGTWRGTGRYREHNGTRYQVTRCTNMTTVDVTLDDDDVDVFTDGEEVTDLLTNDAPGWWQDGINESIDSRSDVDTYTDSGEIKLEMKSNQALVELDYPDSTNSTNRLVMLYQIGRAESDVRAEGVVNIRVRNVKVDP